MKSRILVCVLGVPVLVYVVLFAPPFVLMLALGGLSGIAAAELLKCVGVAEKKDAFYVLTLLCAFLSVYYSYQNPAILPMWLMVYVVAAFFYAIVRAGEVKLLQLLAGIFAVVVIPYAFSGFLRIQAGGFHRGYLLLPFILSFMSDTGGYVIGCTLGKHKLAPKVSPKKSVEGAVGGLLGNVLGAVAFVYVMNTWFGQTLGYGVLVVLALLCSVIAQIGDLSFSLIKREFGIKDYGRLFLDHGGVLDRFDSVLFVTPLVWFVLSLV